MPRYVMANLLAGLSDEGRRKASRSALESSFDRHFRSSVEVLGFGRPERPTSRRVVVFEAEPDEVEAKRALLPEGVLVEREVLHFPVETLPLDLRRPSTAGNAASTEAEASNRLDLVIRGSGAGLHRTKVALFLRSPARTKRLDGETDARGRVVFGFSPPFRPAAAAVMPAGGFWSTLVRGPEPGMTIDLVPLPMIGPLGWWHHALGITEFAASRGAGVCIGVVDTGCGPHGFLGHVGLAGAFLDGLHAPGPLSTTDVESHGTHVCGILGALPPSGSNSYAGIATGAELWCARVLARTEGGANQGDIANAIDFLSRETEADLIALGLGSDTASEIERDAILAAAGRGTLCVAGAGNEAGPVGYPARFPEVVAVAAIGLEGWGPAGSLSAGSLPASPELFGPDGSYLASFSSFGPELACGAPGVGILSTVPERYGLVTPYAAMDGTSLAGAAVCGALAVLLGRTRDYLSLPRQRVRSATALRILEASCRRLGLRAGHEGAGMPNV